MVQSNKGETHSDVLLLSPHQYNQKPTMKARAPVEPQEACEGAHRRYTLREPRGQGVGEVGRPGWNETNGTENVSPNWTRLFLVAKNLNKVSFQPRDMEATAPRKRLPGCYNLGVHIHFSHNGLWMQFCTYSFQVTSKVTARLRRWPVPFSHLGLDKLSAETYFAVTLLCTIWCLHNLIH